MGAVVIRGEEAGYLIQGKAKVMKRRNEILKDIDKVKIWIADLNQRD